MNGIERKQVMDPERGRPTLLNFVLRVLAPDGQLYETDGNKDLSIAVYPVEYSRTGHVVRTSEHPIIVMAGTDEMGAAVNEVADLILKNAEPLWPVEIARMKHSPPSGAAASPKELTPLQAQVAAIEMVFSHQGGFSDAEIAGIVQRFIENEQPPTA